MSTTRRESIGTKVSGAPLRNILVIVLISLLLVIPCFWHEHIQAGDLGSHAYNAWLAQLIEQGKAPGLYLVVQWQNVLFDLLLSGLVKVFGFSMGEKLAVSVCVLIFFWGVFALLRVAAHRAPWFLVPLIAMTSYGYVFHMGFMNYYLSLGLACFCLAMLWNEKLPGIAGAALLASFVMLAHPLGILWLVALAAYRFTWLRLAGWLRLALPILVAAGLYGVRWYFLQHPNYQADWAEGPFYQWNGADQFRIFGAAYYYLTWVLVFIALGFTVVELFRHSREADFWNERRLLVELYFVSFCAAALLPEDLRPDPTGSWIGGLATRLTLVCTIFGVAFLATLRPRIWHLVGYGACAAVFFFIVHRDTGVLDRMEKNVQAITRELPFGTRVASTIYAPPGFRTQFEHLVDRACIGHCFLYSNYEPSTQKFRVRVRKEGSRLVASTVDESEDLQSGDYEIEAGDLPMKQIYQCDAADLTRICIRDLEVGETNGRVGYRPR
jgi:hypothetical protein